MFLTFAFSAIDQLRPSMMSTMSEHMRHTSLLPANHLGTQGPSQHRTNARRHFSLELSLAAKSKHSLHEVRAAPYLRYIFSSVGTSGSFPGTLEPSKRAWPETS